MKSRFLVAMFLASCATGERVPGDGEDRQGNALDHIVQHATTPVCSGRLRCYAHLRADKQPAATPGGLGPSELAAAYKLNTSLNPGATIAIVDAFNYPNAESDLAKYRSTYGLPPCTTASGCLRIVNQNGQAAPLPANAPANDDWTVEAALDLDLASAACPHCKLILVEAQDDQSDGLYIGNNGAASLGATVISNSWGGAESNPGSMESYFAHPGIGIFVASGDAGYTGSSPDYPSTSAHVTAVGGTSLVKASNARGWTEGAWSSGGSSCSGAIAKPSYQTSSACSHRMTADVSAVGDPNTGLAVYNNGSWQVVGGTSAASPFVAGVYALYGHGGEAPGWAYSNASKFFDVTTGSNGSCGNILCNAGAGWDGPTGIGTPNGSALGGGSSCTPSCSGKTCGDDGCGGSCGSCAGGETCSGGVCMGGGGGGSCAHPICSTGGTLTASCDPCAQQVCAQDSYCCGTSWDSVCVGEVGSICGQSCSGGGGGGGGGGSGSGSGSGGGSTCSHSICSSGTKLTSGCDACAANICSQDSYCCTTKWDSQCVSEVSSICNESCN